MNCQLLNEQITKENAAELGDDFWNSIDFIIPSTDTATSKLCLDNMCVWDKNNVRVRYNGTKRKFSDSYPSFHEQLGRFERRFKWIFTYENFEPFSV